MLEIYETTIKIKKGEIKLEDGPHPNMKEYRKDK